MDRTRRSALLLLAASRLAAPQPPDFPDETPQPNRRKPFPNGEEGDPKLPNGKSQKDAIAQQEHEKALKAAGDLIALAQQVKDELEKAGNFVVPVSTIKKTEEIEKLARKIRGRLKD